MILVRNEIPLPVGQALIIDNTEYPYGALITSEELRDDLGITVAPEPEPEPEPEPVRPELPKSTVIARVQAIGKTAAVYALMTADPINILRWGSPDWPNVFCDDPGMLQLLTAAGCTEEEIAEITAH